MWSTYVYSYIILDLYCTGYSYLYLNLRYLYLYLILEYLIQFCIIHRCIASVSDYIFSLKPSLLLSGTQFVVLGDSKACNSWPLRHYTTALFCEMDTEWQSKPSDIKHCTLCCIVLGDSLPLERAAVIKDPISWVGYGRECGLVKGKKVKVWTLAIVPLTWVRLVTSSALQSRKWQLISMSQWCRSALCGHLLPALTDSSTHGTASRHTIAPISHTRPSPHSRSYYSFLVPLRVGGWVGLSIQ